MAIIDLGPIVTRISGKIAGLIFSQNSGGPYVRAAGDPVNPQTPLQSVYRAIFATLVTVWREVLTQAQRDAWNVYGSNVVYTNRLGKDVFLSGFNHFMRGNTVRVQAGLSRVDDGPATFSLADQDPTISAAISEATQNMAVTFDDTKPWVDEDDGAMIIYAGIPKDPSVDFFNGPWRLAGAIEGDGVTPPTTPASIAEPWPVVELQKQTIYGRISRADGRLSNKFLVTQVAGA